MSWIFDIKDINGKRIHLSQERWVHINVDHPELSDSIELIKETLKIPTKCEAMDFDENIRYFYKHLKLNAIYLLVIVKYLNGEGFVITSYLVRQIK